MQNRINHSDLLVIGAGPAGLTAAYEALKLGKTVTILEKDNVVGGISRTVKIDEYKFDLGGHRFFTKVDRVEKFWHEILPDSEFLQRPRMSRILYKGAFFDYPLKATNALRGLGLLEAIKCVLSYFKSRIFPPKIQDNFEDWVTARFGKRLYSIFFKTYTEKVWGINAREISSAWAAQRIKNLSLGKAILNAFGFGKGTEKITTLIDTFQYPKFGPGQMWEKCLSDIELMNGKIIFDVEITGMQVGKSEVQVETNKGIFTSEYIVTTLPINDLPKLLGVEDSTVINASSNLKHRDFLTVALVVQGEETFPDNWIYVHTPEVKVGRIQNFRSWSPEMSPEGQTCLGLEYFVNQGDSTWESTDDELVNLGKSELAKLGLIDMERVIKGYVVRVPKAYPVYDEEYEEHLKVLANFINTYNGRIQPVGRNGMHRYNNQDHSMLTAMYAVENIFLGKNHNLWEVNVDDSYHEEKNNFGGRAAPTFTSKKN